MKQKEWVAINYMLPREPSRARVSVWRKLKKSGAVSILQSMWVLPSNSGNHNLLEKIKDEVNTNNGEAFILNFTTDLDGEKIIINKFNSARNEEYKEFVEQCEDLIREIEKESNRQNFTFAEIEENEEELNKLMNWLNKIIKRDVFISSLQENANSMFIKCRGILENFCEKVYEFNERNGHKEK
ncbi:MAG: Chromate resistance protein ChrB [Caldisericia bacterium]